LNKRIKLITRIGRSGLSSAIKEGLIFAQGKYILVLDGDGQHHPSFVLDMLDVINKKNLILSLEVGSLTHLNKKDCQIKEL